MSSSRPLSHTARQYWRCRDPPPCRRRRTLCQPPTRRSASTGVPRYARLCTRCAHDIELASPQATNSCRTWPTYSNGLCPACPSREWYHPDGLQLLGQWERVYAVLDADAAGRNAAARLIDAFGSRLIPVRLPPGVKDPADLAPLPRGGELLCHAVRLAVEYSGRDPPFGPVHKAGVNEDPSELLDGRECCCAPLLSATRIPRPNRPGFRYAPVWEASRVASPHIRRPSARETPGGQ
jgi:hypothetical protein